MINIRYFLREGVFTHQIRAGGRLFPDHCEQYDIYSYSFPIGFNVREQTWKGHSMGESCYAACGEYVAYHSEPPVNHGEFSMECVICHPQSEIFAGIVGDKCEFNHIAFSWYPALLVNYQFTPDHGDEDQQEYQIGQVACLSKYTSDQWHEHPLDEIQEKHEELGLSVVQMATYTDHNMDIRLEIK